MTWTPDRVREAAAYGVETRRWLHRHPELSFQEKETAAFIASQLREMGYAPEVGTGGLHSVKAVLRGGRQGRTIALRADIDALPIQEETGLPYASEASGVMHACGHDMHAAALLAAARALKPLADDVAGSGRARRYAALPCPSPEAIRCRRRGDARGHRLLPQPGCEVLHLSRTAESPGA